MAPDADAGKSVQRADPFAPLTSEQLAVGDGHDIYVESVGRSGGIPDAKPMIYAVDKTTGKQVGAVEIPSRTTAVPMTFMHQGKQYVVFATGAGANTSLVALRLP